MQGLTSALSSELVGPGGCNEGFLRDDALLVVTLITDEDDTTSEGTVDQWRQAVIDAKGGDDEAVVMLGIISDVGLDGALCSGTESFPAEAPLMQEFVGSFPRHEKASICLESYDEFFTTAIGTIDTACDEFVPPG